MSARRWVVEAFLPPTVGLITLRRVKLDYFSEGPYKVDGKFTTESNEQFDTSLRQRNPGTTTKDLDCVGVLISDVTLRVGLSRCGRD